MDSSIFLGAGTLVGVAGLVLKEVIRSLRYRKYYKNENDDKKELKESLKTLKELSGRTGNDVAIIKTQLLGFDKRCSDHLEVQGQINNKINGTLKILDSRVYDIATKKK